MNPRRRRTLLAPAVLLPWWRGLHAKGEAPLAVGILPNLSPRALIGRYQAFGRYLERVLSARVEILTANGWRSFHERALGGDYDLIVTAAHLARLGQVDGSLVPLACFEPPIRALLVHGRDRPLAGRDDLRGHTIALSNPASLVALRGLRWLEESGLQRDRDYRTAAVATDDSLGAMILRGAARAAILSDGEFRAVPEPERQRLEIHAAFAEVPGFVALAHPKLGESRIDALRAALLALDEATDEGRQFFASNGIRSVVAVAPAQWQALDVYLDDTRRLLAGGA